MKKLLIFILVIIFLYFIYNICTPPLIQNKIVEGFAATTPLDDLAAINTLAQIAKSMNSDAGFTFPSNSVIAGTLTVNNNLNVKGILNVEGALTTDAKDVSIGGKLNVGGNIWASHVTAGSFGTGGNIWCSGEILAGSKQDIEIVKRLLALEDKCKIIEDKCQFITTTPSNDLKISPNITTFSSVVVIDAPFSSAPGPTSSVGLSIRNRNELEIFGSNDYVGHWLQHANGEPGFWTGKVTGKANNKYTSYKTEDYRKIQQA